jgi:hypothetical protein
MQRIVALRTVSAKLLSESLVLKVDQALMLRVCKLYSHDA